MNTALPKKVHLIGIGGINMSAIAKLLRHADVAVSGSDAQTSPIIDELVGLGIAVKIGHARENIPEGTELVIYSSAVKEENVERAEARHREIKQQTNFEFLGDWSQGMQSLVVTGTHGKSTTTALLGLILIEAEKDPTVIVGSKVPGFPEGNLRLGKSDLAVIEGDEYERHFFAFHPKAVILNNIEWDHIDTFPELSSMIQAFRELLWHVRDRGLVVANADDQHVGTLIGEERTKLEARGVTIRTYGFGAHADVQIADYIVRTGEQVFVLRDEHGLAWRYRLHVPGKMNVQNVAAAITLATYMGVQADTIRKTLANFHGIWRRFETVADKDGILVVSDYGHHPTAVRLNLEATKAFYPGRRVVLCFQPHQRQRTKSLFLDFVPSFDQADAVMLSEIYEVKGRERPESDDVSSRDLQEAILHHDADRGVNRPVEYVANTEEALAHLKRWRRKGDVIIVMGAGDIYQIADKVLE